MKNVNNYFPQIKSPWWTSLLNLSSLSSLCQTDYNKPPPPPQSHWSVFPEQPEYLLEVVSTAQNIIRFLVINQLQNWCGDVLFFANREICIHRDQISHIPLCEKVVKTQHGRIPINPATLTAIGHRFIAKQRKNLKWQCAGLRWPVQKLETLFGPNLTDPMLYFPFMSSKQGWKAGLP